MCPTRRIVETLTLSIRVDYNEWNSPANCFSWSLQFRQKSNPHDPLATEAYPKILANLPMLLGTFRRVFDSDCCGKDLKLKLFNLIYAHHLCGTKFVVGLFPCVIPSNCCIFCVANSLALPAAERRLPNISSFGGSSF